MFRLTFARFFSVYRREWWRFALAELLAGVGLLALVGVMYALLSPLVSLFRGQLVSNGALNPTGVLILGIAIIAVFMALGLPLTFAGIGAISRMTNDATDDKHPRLFRSVLLGIRLGYRLTATGILGFLGFAVLLVLSPVVSVVGLLGLLVSLIVWLARRRSLPARWPSWRFLGFCAMPTLQAFRWLAGALLSGPAIVLDSEGPISGLRAGMTAVRGRRILTLVASLLAVLVGWGLNFLLGWVGSLLDGLLLEQLLVGLGEFFALGLPIVMLAVIYRLIAEDQDHPLAPVPLPGSHLGRLQPSAWPAAVRRVAMVMPGVLIVAIVGLVPVGAASAATVVTYTVNSAADVVDPTTLATEESNCSKGTGTCTLRAALGEANTLANAGTSATFSIVFSGNEDILVDPSSPIVFLTSGGGESAGSAPVKGAAAAIQTTGATVGSGTVTINGAGHDITLDGQNAVADLYLFSHTFNFAVSNLELKNAQATDASIDGGRGGGLYIGGTGSSVVNDVTFDNDSAVSGGGLATGGPTVLVVNSTFSHNSLLAAGPDDVPGGADLFGAALTTTASNDTFADAVGGSIYSWGNAGYSVELDNSIVAVTAAELADSGGATPCMGGGLTGSMNVELGLYSDCGSSVVNTSDTDLGALTRTNADYPPVLPLLPNSSNAAIGEAGSADVPCQATDARGQARPTTGCDAGSYQFDPVTTTTVSSSKNPSSFGDDVTFTTTTAAVNEPDTIAGGTVQFSVDGTGVGSPQQVNSSGQATFDSDSMLTGSHSVSATFVPASGSAFSTSTTSPALSQTVNAAATAVGLSSSVSTANLGDSVTFTMSLDPSRVFPGTFTLKDITSGGAGTVLSSGIAVGSGNQSTFATTTLPAGVRTIVATYSGDAQNAAGTSSHVTVDVLAPSTTTLTTSATSAAYGASVTLTAQVSGSAGTATGSVIFVNSTTGTTVGTATLNSSGAAVLATTALAGGSDAIVAYFQASTLYQSSQSAAKTVSVFAASTTTTVAASPTSTDTYGSPVVLTATVKNSESGDAANPAGTVQLLVNGSVIATVATTATTSGTSTASYTTTVGQLPAGAASISASFVPDVPGNFNSSASGNLAYSVTKAPTKVVVTTDGTPAPFGHLVQLTATVSATGTSTAVPTGSVTFTDGTTTLGTANLVNGVASFGTATLATGSHSITATYAATTSFGASSGSITQVISTAATTTTLTVPGTTVFGQSATFGVTVSATGGAVPTGTVVLKDGTTQLATLTLVNGSASTSLSTLGGGSHSLTATFAGGGGFTGSSDTETFVVTPASTTTALSPSLTYLTYGTSDTLTATVTDTSTGAAPEGSVQFLVGGVLMATVPVVAGSGNTATAVWTTTGLPADSSLLLNANFVPDGNFASSTINDHITVNAVNTVLALALSHEDSTTPITATATVTSDTGATPVGSVTFTYGSAGFVDVVPLVNGVATDPLGYLQVGDYPISAVYHSSSANFLDNGGSDSGTYQFTVGQGVTDTTLTDTASNTFSYGTTDTLTDSIQVMSAGPAPSGSVTFTAEGPQGTTTLATVALTPELLSGNNFGATATLATSNIPLGTQHIVASWPGDSNYQGSTASLDRTVTVATTTTTITPQIEPSWVGAPVEYDVQVTSSNGATPTGTVTLTSNGMVLGSNVQLVTGRAAFSDTPSVVGSYSLVATYTPTDNNFGGSSKSLTHSVVALPTTTYVFADNPSPGVGQTVTFTATVAPPAGYQVATSASPDGEVVIRDGSGHTCYAVASTPGSNGDVTGTCTMSFPHAGTVSVTAAYQGDGVEYAASTSAPYSLTVGKSSPSISFTTSGNPWVGGESSTLYWTVNGPTAADATISISYGSKTICTSQVLSGSCNYTLPALTNGTQEFDLSYAGDSDWSSATASITPNVVGCVPYTPATASPSTGGTVVTLGAPDCDNGKGFRVGDSVTFAASPAHGYVLGAWMFGTEDVNGNATVTVGPGYTTVTNTAYFNPTCVTVTLGTSGLPGTIQTTPQEPNCGSLPYEWSYSQNGDQSGSFSPGTVMTITIKPQAATGNQPTTGVTAWTGLLSGEPAKSASTTITLTPGVDRNIRATIGTACYANISFPTPGGGTSTMGPTNCYGLDGPGYSAGSLVHVTTAATGTGYFQSWTGNGTLQNVVSTATGSSADLLITGDNITIGASYGGCVYAPVQTQGPGTAAASPSGNCPSQGTGWYTPGSTILLQATPGFYDKFEGWSGAAVEGDGAYSSATAIVTQNGAFIANFYEEDHCVPIHFVSVPAGAVTISAAYPEQGDVCPAGEYDDSLMDGPENSTSVTFTATPVSGAAKTALIGFSVDTTRQTSIDTWGPYDITGIQGSSLATGIDGETTVTATVCENLNAQLTLISPNGTAHTETAPTDADFIDVTPTPNCPYGINNYVVGSRPMFPAANGDENGYTFEGWSGAITSTSKYPTTGVVFDGSVPSTTLTATYQVICHTLTSNWDYVAVAPDPNCPDTDASQHSYIGGTDVALQETGDGDLLFRGWTGNPTTTDGDVAVANMTSDKTVNADYSAETTGEKIVGGLETAGNSIAVVAKKAVGVVASIATGLILGSNPLIAIASAASAVATIVIEGLQALGVSGSAFDSVKSGVQDVAAMMAFISSTTNCATVWANGTGNNTATVSTDTNATGAVGQGVGSEVLTQQSIADEQEEAEQRAAIEGEYGADVEDVGASTTDQLGRLGAVAAVGASLYGEVTSGGLTLDSDAQTAWTEGGDAYERCMEDAIPSYLGLPPAPTN